MDTGQLSQPEERPLLADRHPELPLDPDVDSAGRVRPLHLRVRYLYVVGLGGAMGAGARYALELALPAPDALPLPTLAINLVGSFALGVLLEWLARTGPDRGWLRLARLHFGTGFLGAFTTYSAFSLEAVELLRAGRWGFALAYLLTTIVGGALLAAAGILLAGRRRPVSAEGSR